MTLGDAINVAIAPALSLLPKRMRDDAAVAMLLAIGLQESRFQHRRQIGGPARGLWQFELGGVRGVLTHPESRDGANDVARRLLYPTSAEAIHEALEHNDVLAAAFARLLLWTLPEKLPEPESPEDGWSHYTRAWRPGKPHPATWAGYYRQAWGAIP